MSLLSNIIAFIQGVGADIKGVNQRLNALESLTAQQTQDILARKKKDQFIDGSIFLDFPSIPAGTTSGSILGTIPGAVSGDRVVMGFSSNMPQAIDIKCVITGGGSNNAVFRAKNNGLTDVDPPNGTYRYTILKPNDFS